MIDELRMPTARGALSGRTMTADGRGPGGFDVALGGALEPAHAHEMTPGADALAQRGPAPAPARAAPAAEGNPADRMLRARRQAERQARGDARTEARPASPTDAGRAEREADAGSDAGKPPAAHRRLAPETNGSSPTQTAASAEGDAADPRVADAAPEDGEPGKADTARQAATSPDAAALLMNPAGALPRPNAGRPTGNASPAQSPTGESDPLAAAGGSARHLPGAAARNTSSDPAAVASGAASTALSRQASLMSDAAALAASGGASARQGGATIALNGMMTGSEVRPGDTQPATPQGSGPRREGPINPMAAAHAARVDWRPGGGAGSQAGEQNGPGSGDMGAPARLLAALEEMRQSGGSASSQGAAAFAAALASSQATTGPTPSPGAAEPPPVRLSNPWPVDHPAFPAHLAEQVGDSLLAGLDRAEITVTPPEMGPIRIELSLNGEQASVAFSATQPDTRTAIEQSLPLLKSMLSEQGLQLADSSVGSGYRPPADAGAQSPAGDGAGSRDTGQPGGRTGGSGTASLAGASVNGGTPSAGRANGLLDLFA
jgi:flagellar hook-length control protein FliK